MPSDLVGSSQLFMLFSIILIVESIKTLFLGTTAAFNRKIVGHFLNEEDATLLGGKAVEIDHATPGRFFRAQRNNIENLLPFLILGSLYLISGASMLSGAIYFSVFFLARLAHTFAYINKRPLLRRNTYATAWLAQIVIGIHAGAVIVQNGL